MVALLRAAVLASSVLGTARSHGAVTHPPPREAVDGATTAPWNGSVPWPIPFDSPNWCAHPSASMAGIDPRNLSGSNGQACFWFSNGCGIGSPHCDGNSGQLVPCCTHKYRYNGTGSPPPFGQCNAGGCIVKAGPSQPAGGLTKAPVTAPACHPKPVTAGRLMGGQSWTLGADKTIRVGAHSEFCLDLDRGPKTLVTYPCNSISIQHVHNQQWEYRNATRTLHSAMDPLLCVDLGPKSTSPVTVQVCAAGKQSQQWTLATPAGAAAGSPLREIASPSTGSCLEWGGGGDGVGSGDAAAGLPDPFDPKLRPRGAKGGKPTLCDPKYRTVNTAAECGSKDDYWQFSPWRAPGSVPVLDACGVAGGRLPGQGDGTAGADYVNTTNAKLADKGSTLKPAPSGTVWTSGTDVEVSWTQKAWHGGGYSYRLCPADSPLTEACFQKHPLAFAGQASLRWGGVGGEQLFFNATDVSGSLVVPAGSTWRKCPIPRGPWGWIYNGPSFEPVCEESEACKALVNTQHSPGDAHNPCRCSGDGVGDLATLEMVDKVHIPADLPAGEWVLGWRWDCEESTQVWSSCSDVTIVS